MDGVGPLRFVQRHALGLTLERVAPVAEAIRPRREHLPATADAISSTSNPSITRFAGDRVVPQRGADLGDDGVLLAVADLELATRRRQVLVRREWTRRHDDRRPCRHESRSVRRRLDVTDAATTKCAIHPSWVMSMVDGSHLMRGGVSGQEVRDGHALASSPRLDGHGRHERAGCRDRQEGSPARPGECGVAVAVPADRRVRVPVRLPYRLVRSRRTARWTGCAFRGFDSASVFGSLLDREAGLFRLGPFGINVPSARHYEPGTNVLVTTWKTPQGRVVVRDALTMGASTGSDSRHPALASTGR